MELGWWSDLFFSELVSYFRSQSVSASVLSQDLMGRFVQDLC